MSSVPVSNVLKDLLVRRQRLGPLGAIDFLIDLQCKRERVDKRSLRGFPEEVESEKTVSKKPKQSDVKDKTVQQEVMKLNQGFEKPALKRLAGWAFSETGSRRKRLTALWELGRWHANIGNYSESVACLSKLVSNKPKGISKKKLYLMLADTLVRNNEAREALSILTSLDQSMHDPDLMLCMAFAEAALSEHPETDMSARVLEALNKIYARRNHVELSLDPGSIQSEAIDRISHNGSLAHKASGPKVSVVFPCFNCAEFLNTAVASVRAQTWENLEIILVDDCSTDNTRSVIEKIAKEDDRVVPVYRAVNGGAYSARNDGLSCATGELFTCHDSDDYSHPQKIEAQVKALLNQTNAIGCLSQHVRMTPSMEIDRRGNAGFYIFPNLSSLMFWRKKVVSTVGYWDTVRFGADGEFKARLENQFGKESILKLDDTPLSLVRSHSGSLTNHTHTGYRGHKFGARHEHEEAFRAWYGKLSKEGRPPFIDYPLMERPFPLPKICVGHNDETQYDIVILSEFRLPGGTTSSNAHEILASYQAGYKVGIIQAGNYRTNPEREMNPKIRTLVEQGKVDVIVFGEKVHAKVLIIRFPLVLDPINQMLPTVKASDIRVVVNQPPQRTWSEPDDLLYDVERCHANVIKVFGLAPKWHPIGPTAREGFDAVNSSIKLESWDWVNLIDSSGWKRKEHTPNTTRPVIARHSRDHWSKWPEEKLDLLSCYPNSESVKVKILGGAESAKSLLGYIPKNWEVFEFGEKDPAHFLKDVDVYVYFTHSQYLEAFGRAIFEAMAVGIPVILPPQFAETFGNSALYCAPEDVTSTVYDLVLDSKKYREQVMRGHKLIDASYSFDAHVARMNELLQCKRREAGFSQ